MTDLFTLQTALAQAINADPVLCLAHAVAWLDPLWQEADDFDLPEGEEDTLPAALHILRRAFPDIYFEALLAIRRNGTAGYAATYQQLDHLICDAVQQQGIPLENLEWIGYGIPLPAYGAVLDDPDFYTTHPDTIPVLECFGISPEPNSYNIVVPEVACKAAEIIADDLMQQADERWRQVAWLVRFLFSISNNSSVDFDLEMMSSVQPLSWDAEDIAFARELIEEAEGIMQDVTAALEHVRQHPTMLAALTHNVRKIYLKKGQHNARYRLEWPCLTDCDERRTQLVA